MVTDIGNAMGRSGEFIHYGESRRPTRTRALRAEAWNISHVLAWGGTVVLLVAALVVTISGAPGVRDRVVPKAVRDWFDRPVADKETGEQPGIAETVRKALGVPERGSGTAVKRFGLGSSKAEVRAAQGPPTSETESTWHYGDSEVHFVAGRVVSWRDSSANPLRLRR